MDMFDRASEAEAKQTEQALAHHFPRGRIFTWAIAPVNAWNVVIPFLVRGNSQWWGVCIALRARP